MGSLMKRGGVYFGCLRDLDGKKVRYSTGQRTPAKAGAILAEWEKRVAAGLLARPDDEEKRVAAEERKRREATKGLTLHGLCNEFRKGYSRPRIKRMNVYWGTYGSYLKQAIQAAPIASLPAAAVRKADVEEWRDSFLRKHYAPRTVNVVLGLLATVYTWALDRDLLNMRNPCRGVEHAPVPPEAPGSRPTLAQVQKLLEEPAEAMLRAMLQVALLAGLRHGELAGLRWRDIQTDAPTPHIIVARSYRTTPKNNRIRVTPLHPILGPILDDWRPLCAPSAEGLVFPVVTKAGARMAKDCEMHGLPELMTKTGFPLPRESSRRGRVEGNRRAWHALKKVFLTRCRDCGIPPDVVSEFGAHTMKGGAAVTAAHYLYDTPEHLQRLAAELARLWYIQPAKVAPEAPQKPPEAHVATREGQGAKITDIATARAARDAKRAAG